MLPPASELFELELLGNTLVATPRGNLGEFKMSHFEEEAPKLLHFWHESGAQHLIVDFRNTDYFGSTTLGVLVKLGHVTAQRGGRLVICGISAHESEIIALTGLKGQWPICPTREAALELLQASSANAPH